MRLIPSNVFAAYLTILVGLAVLPGCMLGSATLRHSRTQYNKALHRTAREEMLLNLVRMKYRESVEFVKIPSITGQHSYSAGMGMKFAPGNDQSYSPSFSAQSKPTIVYQPEQAQEFNRRLLTPISLVTLDQLTSKGWAADRVLKLTVRNINDVDNATSAGGPTPANKPEFEEFRELVRLLRDMQMTRDIEITYENLASSTPKRVSDEIDINQVDGSDYLQAAQKGYEFRRNGNVLTLWTVPKKSNELVLRVSHRAHARDHMRRVAKILRLKLQQEKGDPSIQAHGFHYRMKPDNFGQLGRRRQKGNVVDSTKTYKDLIVSTRSLKEMMFYLSHGIVAPQQHVDSGLIMRTMMPLGNGQTTEFDWRDITADLFQVTFSKHPPKQASVSVFYRGYYFYIDDADLNSKATFNLMLELFNLEIRAGGGGQIPLLTI